MTEDGDRYLLDTSAVLTLIEDEAGADRVQEVLESGHSVFVPWPVLLEATYITRQERGEAEAHRRYALLRELGATILWEVDETLVLTAARLKAEHRISLADAIIASYAVQSRAVLVHKDPEYEPLSDALRLETLPYKG
ncbi:MAG: PIN domain-containing protein [Deltaproteobacteria bacterium]|nr:PIN domain-containing protein [Deltaproteobacteria bacterium]